MEFKQAMAFVQVLAFLGTAALLGAAAVTIVAVRAIGEERLSRWFGITSNWVFGGRGLAIKLLAAALILFGGYFAVLLGASLSSHEWVLSPGEEKYFCEADCHLAYSVVGVVRTSTLGSGPNQATAEGVFYVVTVRTRFDEKTISPHRGDAPLQPAPRVVPIMDQEGRRYPASVAGEQALAQSLGAGAPMSAPLRPGESYTTQLVFDLPRYARNPRLLIASLAEPEWLGRVLIGDENSILHKKVFFRLAG